MCDGTGWDATWRNETGQKETGSDPEGGVNVIPIDTWEQAAIWRRRQRMVSFDCNGTISEVASTNRSEVLFVEFGQFSFVVASHSRFEI